jgi:sugar phosphate isomerase/epimerase
VSPFPAYGMDTGFYSRIGSYPPDVRCEMLAELGYDATYLTLWSETAWADLDDVAASAARHRLTVAAVNVVADAGAPVDAAENDRIVRMIGSVSATHTVEIAIRNDRAGLARSDTAGDSDALRFLTAAVDAAERNDVVLLLYPHTFYWLERVEDAVRLCEAIQHPRLQLLFPAFHWYAVDNTELQSTLRRAAPYLAGVNVNGSRRVSGHYFPATIEPLDSGDLDNFAILGALRALRYDGMIGIQGYGVGGDAYDHFRRSINALRDIERRLDRHPDWARLRSDHI